MNYGHATSGRSTAHSSIIVWDVRCEAPVGQSAISKECFLTLPAMAITVGNDPVMCKVPYDVRLLFYCGVQLHE